MPNLKLAFRTLFKSPFVTAVAALSLALGIGANAAIYSIFDEMLRRPVPAQDPGQLVNLAAPGPKPGSQSCGDAGPCEAVFSYPMFRDLERAQTVLTGLAAHKSFGTNVSFRGQSLNTDGLYISGSYFPTLGLRPALGRLITPSDDDAIGAHPVAVLSYAFWQRTFGGDRTVIDQTIIVNGRTLTIIGIAPEGFNGTTVGSRPKIFVPITMRGLLSNANASFTQRRSYWIYVFGRLKPGVTLDRARSSLNTLYHPIIRTVEAPLQTGMSADRMKLFLAKNVGVEAGSRGQSSAEAEAKTPLLLLLGVTAIVLLIACANIANLLLARSASRAMEMAVRLSLGATRRQLLVQLLTESCLLAVIGGVASVVVARWTLGAMAALLPAEISSTLDFALNAPVLFFTGALSLATGILFGLFPALHSTRPELVTTLRSGAGNLSSTKSATRFRAILVTAQIAMSTALLIAAGLFVRSLNNVSHVNLGVDVEHVATFAVSPALSGYDSVRTKTFISRIEDELRGTPGIASVTSATVPLLAGSNWGNDVSVQGFKKGPDTDANSSFNEISPDYFATLGIRRLAGREFTAGDVAGGPKVAIVNVAFARKFGLLGRSLSAADVNGVIGKRMSEGSDSLDIEIVGLVENAKYSDVKDSMPSLFFTPHRQDRRVGSANFYVRSTLAPEQLLPVIGKLVHRLDATMPVENLKTMPQQIKENVFLDRMISILSASFALLATLLAAIGLYGVLAYSVAQRTSEIGIRVALGADAMRVRLMVLRQVARMTGVGAVIGILFGVGIGRAATALLFGIKGYDPLVFVASTLLLVAVSLAAGYLPALRASRIDPIRALRYE